MKKLSMMTDEYENLWCKARDNFGVSNLEFANLLDYDFNIWEKIDNTPMSEELKRLLIALAGPHGKTILKIHKIRKAHEQLQRSNSTSNSEAAGTGST
jgi:hypothetical protein